MLRSRLALTTWASSSSTASPTPRDDAFLEGADHAPRANVPDANFAPRAAGDEKVHPTAVAMDVTPPACASGMPQQLPRGVIVTTNVSVAPTGDVRPRGHRHAMRREAVLDVRAHDGPGPRVERPTAHATVRGRAHHRLSHRPVVHAKVAEVRVRGREARVRDGRDVGLLEELGRGSSSPPRRRTQIFTTGGGAHDERIRIRDARHARHRALELPHVIERVQNGRGLDRVEHADGAVAAADEEMRPDGDYDLRGAFAALRQRSEDATGGRERRDVSGRAPAVHHRAVRGEHRGAVRAFRVPDAALLSAHDAARARRHPGRHTTPSVPAVAKT